MLVVVEGGRSGVKCRCWLREGVLAARAVLLPAMGSCCCCWSPALPAVARHPVAPVGAAPTSHLFLQVRWR